MTFIMGLGALCYVFYTFPPLTEEQLSQVRLPRNIKDVQALSTVVSLYTDQYYFTVMIGYSLVYLFLQSFCIPGSIFLSFLAGTLFDFWIALPLVCFLSACGASGAYFISSFFGRGFLNHYLPERSKFFGEQIAKHRRNLFNYFLFLRLSPLIPNWFVNIASPVFQVPFHIFWIGTFLGVSVQTFVAVKAGQTLQDIKDVKEIFDMRNFLTLLGLSFLSLIPTLKPVQNFLDRVLVRQNKYE